MSLLNWNQRVKDIFKEVYSDLYVYRLTNRHINWWRSIYIVTMLLSIYLSYADDSCWLKTWFTIFFMHTGAVVIDILYIRSRFNIMVERLNEEGIKVSIDYIIYICEDLIPE